MNSTVEITLERHVNGTTAYWSDETDHLCHRLFIGYTRREILTELRAELARPVRVASTYSTI
jgi:hypothetical protein